MSHFRIFMILVYPFFVIPFIYLFIYLFIYFFDSYFIYLCCSFSPSVDFLTLNLTFYILKLYLLKKYLPIILILFPIPLYIHTYIYKLELKTHFSLYFYFHFYIYLPCSPISLSPYTRKSSMFSFFNIFHFSFFFFNSCIQTCFLLFILLRFYTFFELFPYLCVNLRFLTFFHFLTIRKETFFISLLFSYQDTLKNIISFLFFSSFNSFSTLRFARFLHPIIRFFLLPIYLLLNVI